MKRKSNYQNLYSLVSGERSSNNLYPLCVYCGSPADTRDHVPPITRVNDYRSIGLKNEQYLLVPCCKSCNSYLNDSLQDNIFDRIEHLKDILASKFSKQLKEVEWDDDELEELGDNLRSFVSSSCRKSKNIQSRYHYYGGFDALSAALDL